jgi:two-component system sensor histidine kinase DesK
MSVRVERVGGPLPAPLESILAWAVREGATNVLRHSGAQRVGIRLAGDKSAARLEITDDGTGPSPGGSGAGGSGLVGLRERVEARHGSVEFGARPGGGFRLAVSLPASPALEAAVTE